MNEGGESTTHYCVKCGYNLTGLIKQRCPECAENFSWDALRSDAWRRPNTIRAYSVVWHLIAPPVLLCLLLLLFATLNWEWLSIPVVLFFIGYSLINSVGLCQRISATMNQENPVIRGLGFGYCLLGFGFIVFQWGLAIGIPALFVLVT